MKIVFMGTPNFSVRILEELSKVHEVVLVVTKPDMIVGRKKELVYPEVKTKALSLGLNVFQPLKIKDDYKPILDANAEILITAAYGQIVPSVVLKSFKKCINVHASLLPKYRGGAPIQRSIINGDSITGVSIMEMVQKMDAGDVFVQGEIPILDSDNNDTMFEKLSVLGCKLLLENLDDIVSGKICGKPQDEALVTYAYNISKEDEFVSLRESSIDIFNKIRGLATSPGAYATINNTKIKIYSSSIVEYEGEFKPGQIIDLNKRILVKTLDKAILLTEVKPDGKRLMNAREFVNGQKIMNIGDIFD